MKRREDGAGARRPPARKRKPAPPPVPWRDRARLLERRFAAWLEPRLRAAGSRGRSLATLDLGHHPAVAALGRLGRRLGLWAVGHFVEESLESLWRARLTSGFAVGIIGLSLATVGAFLLVAENLGGVVARMSSLEVSVYLADLALPEEIERVRAAVVEAPGVVSMRYVSKEEALRLFREANPDLASIPAALGENPFPASFEVSLAEEARSPERIDGFARRVGALPGVEAVSRDLALASRILAASRVVQAVAAFLGGVLLLSALFTVSNLVKLTVYTRRDEVEILRLVGASSAYLRGTFVTGGILQGLLGSTLALLVLYASYRLAGSYLQASGLALLASLAARFLSATSVLVLVGAGVTLGAIGSLLPLRRLARG